MATSVTIDLAEFDAIRKKLSDAESEIVQLKAQLSEAKLGDVGSPIRTAHMVVRNALTIVRFGMANMSPEYVRNWPVDQLRNIAACLATLSDYTVDDRELAHEMRMFADDAERWDRRRKLAGEIYAPPPSAPPTLADLQNVNKPD